MSFICTAGDFPPELINGDVVIPIGYDGDSSLQYSILLGFAEMAGGDLEFFWVIVQVDTESGEEIELWSGLDTKVIFGKDDRILIRTALLTGIEFLLDEDKPDRFFCCTHDSDLPQKALYTPSTSQPENPWG
jgi:hypothetical protein